MKKFICISGLDGAGKTTQCKLLYDYFEDEKPIYYEFGEKEYDHDVHRALINYMKNTNQQLDDNQIHIVKSAFYMYYSIKNLSENIKFDDKVVIMDRYVETIYAHAHLYGVSSSIIKSIFNDIYITPDIYVFLDLSPEICYRRIIERAKPIKLHEEPSTLRKIYEYYKNNLSDLNMRPFDASMSSIKLHQEIIMNIK